MTQEAPITLSRQTMERLQGDLWKLTVDEDYQIREALKAMYVNDGIEVVNKVFNPPGTISAPYLKRTL